MRVKAFNKKLPGASKLYNLYDRGEITGRLNMLSLFFQDRRKGSGEGKDLGTPANRVVLAEIQ